MMMTCPLRGDCLEAGCGWWDKGAEQCAVVSAGEGLRKLAEGMALVAHDERERKGNASSSDD